MEQLWIRRSLPQRWIDLYSSIDIESARFRMVLLVFGSILRFPLGILGIMYGGGEVFSLAIIGLSVAFSYIAYKSIEQYHLSSAAMTVASIVGTAGIYVAMPGLWIADMVALFTFGYLNLLRWWPALFIPPAVISLGYIFTPYYMGEPLVWVPAFQSPIGYAGAYFVFGVVVVLATSLCTFPAEVSRQELLAQKDRMREIESHDSEQTRWFQSITSGTTLGLAAMTQDQALVWANSQFNNLLGIEEDEAGKDQIFTWFGMESRRRAADALKEVTAQRQQRVNVEVRPRRLPDKWLDMSIANTSEDGDVYGEEGAENGVVILQLNDITAQRQAELELQWQASRDALTGLPNRSQIEFYVEEGLLDSIATSSELALLFIDLDKFKQINDTLGHEWGDELLRTVAKRVDLVMRHGDVLIRFGGDEFVAILRGLRGEEDLTRIATRIVEELRRPIDLDGNAYTVSASLGAAIYQPGWNIPEFLRAADRAMYEAKDRGRDQFVIYDPALHDEVITPSKDTIRAAIDNDEFVVYYQPILGLNSRKVVGFEALVRWRHPENGLMLPGSFWSTVEEGGYTRRLGELITRQACRDLKKNDPDGDTTVSVNVGASQLSQPDFKNQIERILNETGLAASRLVLDVTEQTVLYSDPVVCMNLESLCEMGVKLAMDDFGKTYSALVALRRYAFHQVKVDRNYIAGLAAESENREVVSSVVGMAHALGMTVVGEGVEHPDQAQWLQRLGADLGQGFAIGHPQVAQEMSNIDRVWVDTHLADPPLDGIESRGEEAEPAALFQHDVVPLLEEPDPNFLIEHQSDLY